LNLLFRHSSTRDINKSAKGLTTVTDKDIPKFPINNDIINGLKTVKLETDIIPTYNGSEKSKSTITPG
jgi:hypothetical protein